MKTSLHLLAVVPGFAINAVVIGIILGFLHSFCQYTVTRFLGITVDDGNALFLLPTGQPVNVAHVLLAALALPVLVIYYRIFLKPLDVVKDPEETRRLGRGIGQRSRRGADGVRTAKDPGNMPPPYPNGWYRVADSADIKRGTTKHVSMLGRQLVVYRGDDGTAAVLDAYCPHLGADLSGGVVVGNQLRCPFHGWEFGTDGQATHIPYCDTVPKFARTESFPIEEANGFIYMYFDADGRPPTWRVPHFKGIDSGEWSLHGRTIHYVHCHVSEIPENGADIAHLPILHEKFILPVLAPAMGHGWAATWERNQELTHETTVNVTHYLEFWGRRFPRISVDVSIRQVGPSLVFLQFEMPFFGTVILSQSVVPLKPLFQQATYHVYAPPSCPRWMAKMVLWSTVQQFERDIEIWNLKRYVNKPMLVKGDGNILGFRRWFQQFYSESSDKLTDVSAISDW